MTTDAFMERLRGLFPPTVNLYRYDNYGLLAQTMQLSEEVGELAESVGLLTGATGKRKARGGHMEAGRRVIEEVLDIMQVCAGLLYILQARDGHNMDVQHRQHISKLQQRNYI